MRDYQNYASVRAIQLRDSRSIIEEAAQARGDFILPPNERGAPEGSIVDRSRLQTELSMVPAPGADVLADKALPQSTYNPGIYGDMVVSIVRFGAAGDILALPRPKGQRVYLIIYNRVPASTITVNFDQVADAVNGIDVANGGNYEFLAAVPQNDLHIFSPAAGNVIIGFINRSIAIAQAGS